MNSLIRAAADHGAEPAGIDVVLPPLYEVFWSAVVFLGIWIVLGWALPKIYAVLDKRQEEIEVGLEASRIASEEGELAERHRRSVLREANERAREIRSTAESDAKRIVAEARKEALVEADRVHENAKRQLANDARAAENQLQADVGRLATDLAEQIIGEQLTDTALSQRVIDRFMDELEAEMAQQAADVAAQQAIDEAAREAGRRAAAAARAEGRK